MASSSGCVRGAVAQSFSGAAEKGESVFRSEPPQPDQRFPRSCRLTSRRQFLAVYGQGRRASCRLFTIFATASPVGRPRLGLTVTRKVGGAVTRNRVKRALREVFRRNRSRMDVPMDLVVNARSTILGQTPRQIERDFLECVVELAGRISR